MKILTKKTPLKREFKSGSLPTNNLNSTVGSSTKNFIQITGSNNATFTTYRSFNCGIGTTTASIYSRSNETTLADGWKGFVEIRVYN